MRKLLCRDVILMPAIMSPNNAAQQLAGPIYHPVASFSKEVNQRLAKRPLKSMGV